MSTLTVWKFPTPEGAAAAEAQLFDLTKQELLVIEDAAVVSWLPGAKKPHTSQSQHLAGAGALGGMFWGLLFGLIFLIPLFGAAIGAATGAIAGALSDVGIDDDFIKRVRGEVTEGTSALLLLTDNVVLERVKATVQGATLIESNLTDEQAAQLKAAIG